MKDGLLNEKKCGYIYSKNKILLKKIYETIIEKHKTRFPSPHTTYTKKYYYLFVVVYTKNNNNIYNIHNHKQIHKIKHYI